MATAKDAKKLKSYNVITYKKGIMSTSTDVNGIQTNDFFLFSEIHNIIHHPNVGIEIVLHTKNRRVFYNDIQGEIETLFNLLRNAIDSWINSNLN